MVAKIGTYEVRRNIPFSAWLYRLAHNLLVDYFRSQDTAPVMGLSDEYVVSSGYSNAYISDHERSLLNISALVDLTNALEGLTPDQSTVIISRFWKELNIAETAEATGNSEWGVKKLQQRGLDTLRRLLANGYQEAETYVGRRRNYVSSAPTPTTEIEGLSEKQLQVVSLVLEGLTFREIGEDMGTNHKTAYSHMIGAMKKLHLYPYTRKRLVEWSETTGFRVNGTQNNGEK